MKEYILLAEIDMSKLMSPKILMISKRHTTSVTLKRPLARMNQTMHAKVIQQPKLLLTNRTFIRLLARVNPHVSFEIVRLGERSGANLALEWALTSVN